MAGEWDIVGDRAAGGWDIVEDRPVRSVGEKLNRAVSQIPQGFNESLAGTVGAIPDMVGAGMRAIGLPSSSPGYYTDLARRGINAVTSLGGLLQEPPKAETTTEKTLYGAGKGLGDAASVLIPATAVAQGARAGTTAAEVARLLAAQPATQLAAGAVGGGVGEATDSPALGLAASIATPVAVNMASRLALPIRPNMDPERQRLVSNALAEGLPLTAAERTGSKPLKMMESAFDIMPGTSGVQAALQKEQQAAWNQAVMSRTGMPATDAAPGTLQTLKADFSTRYNDLAGRNTLSATPDFKASLAALETEAKAYAPENIKNSVLGRIADVKSKITDDAISGRAYREVDSSLAKAARETTDGDLKGYIAKLRSVLQGGMDASISAEDADAWRQLRREYANYAVIRDAMAGAGEAAATGNIPPLALQGALKNSVGRAGYAEGAGDLNDLARTGQAMLRKPPDSGTAGRQMMINLLTGGAGGVGGGLVAGGDLGTAAAMAGATLAIPRAVQSVYNSPWMQRYLMQGIPGLGALADQAPQLNQPLVAALLGQHWRDAPLAEQTLRLAR